MQRAINYWYHGLLRNPGGAEGTDIAPVNEAQVAITRGSLAAALVAMVNGFILLSPLTPQDQAYLIAALTPGLGIVAFLLYGQLDRWLLETPRRQRE